MFHTNRKVILFLLDISIVIITIHWLYFVVGTFYQIDQFHYSTLIAHSLILLLCVALAQLLMKTYDTIWRYARAKEYLKMFLGGGMGYILYLIIDKGVLSSFIPVGGSFAVMTISLLLMLLMRLCYRQYVGAKHTSIKEYSTSIVIIGAGEAGVKLYEEIESNPNNCYKVLFFVDDSVQKIGKRIHGIEVKGPIMELERLLVGVSIKEIVMAIPSMEASKRKEVLKLCAGLPYRVQILPNTLAILQGAEDEHLLKNVRDIDIEELLGREPISLINEEINQFLAGKTVMVTGGGGSIGSELCRQIAKAPIKKLVILDIYENNAYDIQQELKQRYGSQLNLVIEIASVRDKSKVDQLVARHRPNIIFHAAAHKHVPLMEDCPEEAVLNNIYGTYHMALAANRYRVDKFVLISTDKAVNPTSVMGASKRFCEMILQSMKQNSKTEFVAVRFGNVLGSNGSVIPLFQKQISQGGPVTITDKRIVRFFMTISEASQLVLQAGAMANSSEIYVLDMGEPVKILDLAENLIWLSGHIPYAEIPIVESGLRPGEKLYEELLMNTKELIGTQNNKIFIEHQTDITKEELQASLKILSDALKTKDSNQVKIALKQVVPTYKDPDEVNEASNKEETGDR